MRCAEIARHLPGVESVKTLLVLLTILFLEGALNECAAAQQEKGAVQPDALSALFQRVGPSVGTVEVSTSVIGESTSQGTAWVLAPNMIVTNQHVIEGATYVEFVDHQGRRVPCGGLWGIDERCDLAILSPSYPIDGLEGLKLSTAPPRVGSAVVAIGSPLGFELTVSEGIVSAARVSRTGVQQLQTSVAISPGSSGSPLLDMSGAVVGVVTSSVVAGQQINFAVSTEHLKKMSIRERPIGIMHGLLGLEECKLSECLIVAHRLAADRRAGEAEACMRECLTLGGDAGVERRLEALLLIQRAIYVQLQEAMLRKPTFALSLEESLQAVDALVNEESVPILATAKAHLVSRASQNFLDVCELLLGNQDSAERVLARAADDTVRFKRDGEDKPDGEGAGLVRDEFSGVESREARDAIGEALFWRLGVLCVALDQNWPEGSQLAKTAIGSQGHVDQSIILDFWFLEWDDRLPGARGPLLWPTHRDSVMTIRAQCEALLTGAEGESARVLEALLDYRPGAWIDESANGDVMTRLLACEEGGRLASLAYRSLSIMIYARWRSLCDFEPQHRFGFRESGKRVPLSKAQSRAWRGSYASQALRNRIDVLHRGLQSGHADIDLVLDLAMLGPIGERLDLAVVACDRNPRYWRACHVKALVLLEGSSALAHRDSAERQAAELLLASVSLTRSWPEYREMLIGGLRPWPGVGAVLWRAHHELSPDEALSRQFDWLDPYTGRDKLLSAMGGTEESLVTRARARAAAMSARDWVAVCQFNLPELRGRKSDSLYAATFRLATEGAEFDLAGSPEVVGRDGVLAYVDISFEFSGPKLENEDTSLGLAEEVLWEFKLVDGAWCYSDAFFGEFREFMILTQEPVTDGK